jgi:HD-GYP domain-containing protein (c-di-GMP phosphodiesterase class II)
MTRTDVTHTNREQALEEALWQTRHALIQTVQALSAVTSRSDRYTALHQEQVAALALAIGRRLGLGAQQAEGLYLGTAEALAELERGAGSAYDREAVDAVASLVKEAGSGHFWTHVGSDEFSSTVILAQLPLQAAPCGGNESAAPAPRPRGP